MESKLFARLNVDPGFLIIISFILCIILVVVNVFLVIKLSRLDINYKIFMKGKNGKSLENSFQQRFDELDILHEQFELLNRRMSYVEKSFNKAYTKVGIVKYDAFKELGGNLSFALTLLNDHNTGFVMNCIHSRDGSYTYIKNIVKGESELPLSDEERTSVENAIYSLQKIAEQTETFHDEEPRKANFKKFGKALRSKVPHTKKNKSSSSGPESADHANETTKTPLVSSSNTSESSDSEAKSK